MGKISRQSDATLREIKIQIQNDLQKKNEDLARLRQQIGINKVLENYDFVFRRDGGRIRIPIWGDVYLTKEARRIIEHEDFVRLQKTRQLSFEHYVFPGALHSRFEHSIGVYYIAKQILIHLLLTNQFDSSDGKESGELMNSLNAKVFLASSLLHDIGHYPFAHIVEELKIKKGGESVNIFKSHEKRAEEIILKNKNQGGSLFSILKNEWGINNPYDVIEVIEGNSEKNKLIKNMLSGILDPDKMDYLTRDAYFCAVPYGHIETERLIESLVVDKDNSRLSITEKGVSALEGLLFSKYLMFRYVYWHHGVRIADTMLKRFLQDGIEKQVIRVADFYELGNDELLCKLSDLSVKSKFKSGVLIDQLRNRKLYKRLFILQSKNPLSNILREFELDADQFEDLAKRLYVNPSLRKKKEEEICKYLSQKINKKLEGYEVLIDVPMMRYTFDLTDYENLHVLVKSLTEPGKIEPQIFIYSNLSKLSRDFIENSEKLSRKIRIICQKDILDETKPHWKEIVEIVKQNSY